MKSFFNLTSWVILMCVIGSLINCASLSSFQTANTLEKGEMSATLGSGYNHLAEETYGDVGIRYGVGNQSDLGIKYNKTGLGSQVLLVDYKKQISDDEKLKTAFGFGVSPLWDGDDGVALHLPYYWSMHSSTNLFSIYANPRLLYYISADDQSQSSLGLGNSLGLKIGKKLSVMPEWSFVMGEPRGSFDVNHLFSIGVGFNVQ